MRKTQRESLKLGDRHNVVDDPVPFSTSGIDGQRSWWRKATQSHSDGTLVSLTPRDVGDVMEVLNSPVAGVLVFTPTPNER